MVPLAKYFKEKIVLLTSAKKKVLARIPSSLNEDNGSKKLSLSPNRVSIHDILGQDDNKKVKDFETYREKKSKQYHFEENIEKELKLHPNSIEPLLKQRSVQKKNDEILKSSLKDQKEAMNKKLLMRRDRSFHLGLSKYSDDHNIKSTGDLFKSPEKYGEYEGGRKTLHLEGFRGPNGEFDLLKMLEDPTDDIILPHKVSQNCNNVNSKN